MWLRRSDLSSAPGFCAMSSPTPTPTSTPTPNALSAGTSQSTVVCLLCRPTSPRTSSLSRSESCLRSLFKSLVRSVLERRVSSDRFACRPPLGWLRLGPRRALDEAVDRGLRHPEQLVLHEGQRGELERQPHHPRRERREQPAAEHVADPGGGQEHPVRVPLHPPRNVEPLLEVVHRLVRVAPHLLRVLADLVHALSHPAAVAARPALARARRFCRHRAFSFGATSAARRSSPPRTRTRALQS